MTGRQLARVSAVKYRETIWSEMYPGNQHTISCFQPAVLGAETALDLAPAQRRRTVWRLDGGAGSDAQFRWLLARGYHVIGKGLSNFRARALARQARRWDAYADYELAEVPPPVDYGRPVRVFVKRRWKANQWQHSYYVCTLQLPAKGQFMQAYHQRGGAEVEQFRQDKQGLAPAARRKRSLTGQQGYLLLTDLAHNLVADFHQRALQDTALAGYGLKRIVRDLFNVPGRLYFDGPNLKRVELLSQHHHTANLLIGLKKYCLGE